MSPARWLRGEMIFPVADSVQIASTRLRRGSDQPLYRRLRALLSKRDVDQQAGSDLGHPRQPGSVEPAGIKLAKDDFGLKTADAPLALGFTLELSPGDALRPSQRVGGRP